MSRGLKQFVYGTGFLLGFSAIIYSVYAFVLTPTPTCFDARQNGDELGVDCGGLCAPCAQKYAVPIEVGEIATFSADGKTVVVAALSNPNDDYGFEDVVYAMKALDLNGSTVASVIGRTFIYDRRTKGDRYLVNTIDLPIAAFSEVVVEFSDPQVVSREEFVEPDVNIMRSSTDVVGVKRVTEPAYVFTRMLSATTPGDEVKKLEEFLYQKQFLKKLPDSTFDADTRAALVAYQKARSISPASGLFGPATRAKVNAEIDRITKTVVEANASVSISGNVKNDDLRMASKVIVTGFVYDASGIRLGGSKTELEGLQAAEERTFKIIFPDSIPADKVDATKTRMFVDAIN